MQKRIATLLFALSSLVIFSCTKDGTTEGTTDASKLAFSSTSPGGSNGGSNNGGTAGLMTAGEWNDLTNWSFWTDVLKRDTIKEIPALWGFYTTNRITIILKDADGKLVHDARIKLTNGAQTFTAVTDQSGQAEIIAGLFEPSLSAQNFTAQAQYLNKTFDLGTIDKTGQPIVKVVPVQKQAAKNVDVQFVVDATGSMGDEISYLKDELKDVIIRAGSQLPGIQLKLGSVFYRDTQDEYVTRSFPFTSNVNALIDFISAQKADGGGDFPEAVDEALDKAINSEQWSSSAVNRILFLILDAPPHQTNEVLTKLKTSVLAAQEKGIRIIPVTASGIDRETEFLMRFLAISTNGTYTFVTDHSGIGNPHLTPTIGNYQVEFLNNLMVRLITKYGKNMD